MPARYFLHDLVTGGTPHNGSRHKSIHDLDENPSSEADKNKKSFKKVQIAFVHEAYYGQTIKINYFKTEDNLDAYAGYVDDQLSFELILEMEE